MRSRLLISVSAVALLAGAGLASAQDKGGSNPAAAPQTTSPAQQSAPQPGGGGAMKDGADKGSTGQGAGQTEQRQEAPPVRAQQERGDQPKRTQDQRNQRENRAQDQRNDQRNQREERAQDKSDKKGSTTGQGSAGPAGGAAMTSEQRTKISTTIRQSNVKKVTNVNFNASVGTVVPTSVTLHPLPVAVVEVYPQWRGYRFIMVEDEILIIEPGSHRIVAVIDA